MKKNIKYLLFIIILLTSCIQTNQTTSETNIQNTVEQKNIELIPTEIQITDTLIPPTETLVLSTPTHIPTEEIIINHENENLLENNQMNIQIGETRLTATLVENSSTVALKELLSNGPISINMQDYANMEKVGPIGTNLPRNDQQITTEPGDIILYQGSALVIYYAPNSWNFTRLGKIDNLNAQELKNILGSGNVTITLSLP